MKIIAITIVAMALPTFATEYVVKIRGATVKCFDGIEGKFGDLELTKEEWAARAKSYCANRCEPEALTRAEFRRKNKKLAKIYPDYASFSRKFRKCGAEKTLLGKKRKRYIREVVYHCYDGSIRKTRSGCVGKCMGEKAIRAEFARKNRNLPEVYPNLEQFRKVRNWCGVKREKEVLINAGEAGPGDWQNTRQRESWGSSGDGEK